MSDDQPAATLMTRAAHGDKQAWDALVERYAPLVWSICRRHQLGAAATGQAVWLQLAEHLVNIHDPAALARWLAATTRRECAAPSTRRAQTQATGNATAAKTIPEEYPSIAGQELAAAERNAMLREAFARLSPCCQQLIDLLIEDPPVPACPDHRQAGHPGRRHRATSRALFGQAAPRSGDCRPARRQRRIRGRRAISADPAALMTNNQWSRLPSVGSIGG